MWLRVRVLDNEWRERGLDGVFLRSWRVRVMLILRRRWRHQLLRSLLLLLLIAAHGGLLTPILTAATCSWTLGLVTGAFVLI